MLPFFAVNTIGITFLTIRKRFQTGIFTQKVDNVDWFLKNVITSTTSQPLILKLHFSCVPWLVPMTFFTDVVCYVFVHRFSGDWCWWVKLYLAVRRRRLNRCKFMWIWTETLPKIWPYLVSLLLVCPLLLLSLPRMLWLPCLCLLPAEHCTTFCLLFLCSHFERYLSPHKCYVMLCWRGRCTAHGNHKLCSFSGGSVL